MPPSRASLHPQENYHQQEAGQRDSRRGIQWPLRTGLRPILQPGAIAVARRKHPRPASALRQTIQGGCSRFRSSGKTRSQNSHRPQQSHRCANTSRSAGISRSPLQRSLKIDGVGTYEKLLVDDGWTTLRKVVQRPYSSGKASSKQPIFRLQKKQLVGFGVAYSAGLNSVAVVREETSWGSSNWIAELHLFDAATNKLLSLHPVVKWRDTQEAGGIRPTRRPQAEANLSRLSEALTVLGFVPAPASRLTDFDQVDPKRVVREGKLKNFSYSVLLPTRISCASSKETPWRAPSSQSCTGGRTSSCSTRMCWRCLRSSAGTHATTPLSSDRRLRLSNAVRRRPHTSR